MPDGRAGVAVEKVRGIAEPILSMGLRGSICIHQALCPPDKSSLKIAPLEHWKIAERIRVLAGINFNTLNFLSYWKRLQEKFAQASYFVFCRHVRFSYPLTVQFRCARPLITLHCVNRRPLLFNILYFLNSVWMAYLKCAGVSDWFLLGEHSGHSLHCHSLPTVSRDRFAFFSWPHILFLSFSFYLSISLFSQFSKVIGPRVTYTALTLSNYIPTKACG